MMLTGVEDTAICSLEVDSRTRLEASFKGWAPKLPRFDGLTSPKKTKPHSH